MKTFPVMFSRVLLVLACLTFADNLLTASTPFSLQRAYQGSFHIGAALNKDVYVDQDAVLSALTREHFSLVVSGNDFKWERIHPRNGEFRFERQDAMVEMAERQGQVVHGHVLVWHSQTPEWVFQNEAGAELTREELIARMQEHIQTVVGRYKGRIQTWDVVNEAFESDGSLRDSKWRKIIGDDYLEIAFRAAHEADPDAILVYNDYGWANDAKRAAIAAMVTDFKARGVPIHGLGIQGHWQLNYPSIEKAEQIVSDAASSGLWVLLTEVDCDVLPSAWEHHGADISTLYEYADELNPYTDALPANVEQQQAERYRSLFELFLKYQNSIYTVTFWGLTDNDSWLNNFPVRGRTNYPMVFDRDGKPKSSFYSILSVAPHAHFPTTLSSEPYKAIPLHRFKRPANNSHFFTASEAEYQSILPFVESGVFVYEGVSHHVIENYTLESKPVFRLYNRISGSHFYTASRDEMLTVLGFPRQLFSYEGVAFYVFLNAEDGSSPVHRFFAPPSASHFFTISESEKDALVNTVSSEDLSYDGVAWYAYP